MPIVSINDLTQTTCAAFQKAGVPREEARLATDLLVKANLAGQDSHGVFNALPYIKAIKNGHIKTAVIPRITEETPTTAQVDGRDGLGQVVMTYAAKAAVQKSHENPITLITVKNYAHCGQLGSYASIISTQERIGVILLGRRGGQGYMVPWGGRKACFYINTLAVSVPSNQPFPIVLDMAASVAPYGKVEIRHARKEACPEGWIVDSQGNPSTDPQDLFNGGALLPLGGTTAGQKGSGLAFMVGLLAAVLSGAELEKEGTLIIAINPKYFMPLDNFKEEVDRFIYSVHATPPAKGFDAVLVPGERSYNETQKRLKKGVFLEEETWNKISGLASG